MAKLDNSRPAQPAAPLIRQTALDKHDDNSFLRLAVPFVISVAVNGGLIALLFFVFHGPAPAFETETVQRKDEVNMQSPPPPEPVNNDPLTSGDIDPAAIEPDVEIHYDLERKAEVSLPGVVDLNQPVGVENGALNVPPVDLPLPPGLGGSSGQGGAVLTAVEGSSPPVGQGAGGNLRGMAQLAGTIYGRSGATKEKMLREGGGTKETEAAVNVGLNWLIRVQQPNGCWPLDGNFKNKGSANDIAGTAFGLLPFLGAGKTHRASKDNPFDKPIERALLFLIRKQDKRTGNFGGGMYGHCLASIALCEAYGLTQDPFLRRPAQMSVNYIVAAQHDGGGWRYSPGQAGDTSVTGWAVMALKSAKMSGLDVPELSFRKAIRFMDSVNAPNEGYSYVPPERGAAPAASPTMSAVGLLCRQYLQSWGPQNIKMINGVKNNLETVPPPATGGPNNMYYYYYATQVMHHFGGQSWERWNAKMREALVRSQDKSNNPMLKGSWDPTGDSHSAVGGRLMQTSLCLLTLEVYYRHLPLYYREAGERKEKLLTGS